MRRKSQRRKSLQQNLKQNQNQLLALLKNLQLPRHHQYQLLSLPHAQLQLLHLLRLPLLQLPQFCHLHHQWLHQLPQLPIVGVQPVLQPFNELI